MALAGGFSFVGGQTSSLITLNRAGIAPRAEWIPLTIDAQYAVGYTWARQWSARVTQKLGGGKVWLAASVENPETTLSVVNPPAGAFGFNTMPNATSPSSQIVVSSTPGVWYRFHKEPEGTLQAGLSYSCTRKDTWPRGRRSRAPRRQPYRDGAAPVLRSLTPAHFFLNASSTCLRMSL